MSHTPTTKAELKEFLKYEAGKYKRKTIRCPIIELGETSVLWKYMYLMRYAEYHYNSKHKFRYYLYKIRLSRMQLKYGIHIPINTCGKGLKIVHQGNIIINAKAYIGENCSIHVNTSIVAGGRNDGVPSIGNNVLISVGAVVLGDVKIPDNCVVGANSVVNKSFEEENIAIAGVPAKKISNNGKLTWNGGKANG